VQRVAQRRQGIAQLVRERREELVLAPVGLAQLLLRAVRLGEVEALAEDAGDLPAASTTGS
jgi:hypothetical protein